MKTFVDLFTSIDQSTKTTVKVAALKSYFDQVNEMDKLWTMAILSHRRPKRTVKTSLLRSWVAELVEIPSWLFEESYQVVGDLAETLAQIHPNNQSKHQKSLSQWIQFIIDLGELEEEQKKEKVLWAWNQLDELERFIFNKLITGGWRIGLSQKLMVKALAQHTGVDEAILSHKLMGNWTPQSTSFQKLILEENPEDQDSKPYPFYLAYALETEPEELGSPQDWLAEWKWDGIRAQLIVRGGAVYLWSRGEELINQQFPEFDNWAKIIPDGTVLDGELIIYKDEKIQSFNSLQKRLGRKSVSKKMQGDFPAALIAYDLLEWKGQDIREKKQIERRALLEKLMSQTSIENLIISAAIPFKSWSELSKIREGSREKKAEGLMLKKKVSAYQYGRKKGDWWKWKIDPLTVDAVLIYAMKGHGRRANLFTDYTFAVWNEDELVPFTKAYSGLTDEEFKKVDAFIRKNVIDKFGPVRSVKPELVFEIAFEGIAPSSRHKSGIALRFPRMHRWRKDKLAKEANTLADLNKLVELYA